MVGHSWRSRPAASLALALTVMVAAIAAQGDVFGRWEPEKLRRAIEAQYMVVPLKDGVALVPRASVADIKSIEVSSQAIAINGQPVSGPELTRRLGRSEAAPVLALSYVDPARLHALFALAPVETAPAAAAPSPPAEADRSADRATRDRDRPSGSGFEVTHSDARIHIGGSVEVGESESVDGPVVAVGGSAIINGEVRQDVVAVGGDVRVGPRGRVRGDVTSIGGTIEKDPEGEIAGRRNQVGIRFPQFQLRPSLWLPGGLIGHTFGASVELLAMVFRMLLFGLLACVLFLLARNPITRIEHVAAVEPWKAGLVGLLTQLLFIPVFVLTVVVLTVSIIGIPLLLFVPPLAILAFGLALVLGFTAVAYRVGLWAQARFGWNTRGPFVLVLIGLLGIWLLTILARLISLGGLPIWFVSSALLIVGFLVEYVAWTVGLGAAVMTRFGTRAAVVAPPVPPTSTPA
jgi:hypothetical protein